MITINIQPTTQFNKSEPVKKEKAINAGSSNAFAILVGLLGQKTGNEMGSGYCPLCPRNVDSSLDKPLNYYSKATEKTLGILGKKFIKISAASNSDLNETAGNFDAGKKTILNINQLFGEKVSFNTPGMQIPNGTGSLHTSQNETFPKTTQHSHFARGTENTGDKLKIQIGQPDKGESRVQSSNRLTINNTPGRTQDSVTVKPPVWPGNGINKASYSQTQRQNNLHTHRISSNSGSGAQQGGIPGPVQQMKEAGQVRGPEFQISGNQANGFAGNAVRDGTSPNDLPGSEKDFNGKKEFVPRVTTQGGDPASSGKRLDGPVNEAVVKKVQRGQVGHSDSQTQGKNNLHTHRIPCNSGSGTQQGGTPGPTHQAIQPGQVRGPELVTSGNQGNGFAGVAVRDGTSHNDLPGSEKDFNSKKEFVPRVTTQGGDPASSGKRLDGRVNEAVSKIVQRGQVGQPDSRTQGQNNLHHRITSNSGSGAQQGGTSGPTQRAIQAGQVRGPELVTSGNQGNGFAGNAVRDGTSPNDLPGSEKDFNGKKESVPRVTTQGADPASSGKRPDRRVNEAFSKISGRGIPDRSTENTGGKLKMKFEQPDRIAGNNTPDRANKESVKPAVWLGKSFYDAPDKGSLVSNNRSSLSFPGTGERQINPGNPSFEKGYTGTKGLAPGTQNDATSQRNAGKGNIPPSDRPQVENTSPGIPVQGFKTAITTLTPQPNLTSGMTLVSQMAGRMAAAIGKDVPGSGTSSLRIKLKPEKLGEVTVRIVYQQGNIQAHFMAGNAQTRELLEQSMAQLRETLAQQNINLSDTSTSSGENSGRWNQGEQHFQQSQQRSPGDSFYPREREAVPDTPITEQSLAGTDADHLNHLV